MGKSAKGKGRSKQSSSQQGLAWLLGNGDENVESDSLGNRILALKG